MINDTDKKVILMNNIVQSMLYTLLFAAFQNFTCNKLVKNFKNLTLNIIPTKKNLNKYKEHFTAVTVIIQICSSKLTMIFALFYAHTGAGRPK